MASLNVKKISVDVHDLNDESDFTALSNVQISAVLDFQDKIFYFTLKTENTFDDNTSAIRLHVDKCTPDYDWFISSISDEMGVGALKAKELVDQYFIQLSTDSLSMFVDFISKNYKD